MCILLCRRELRLREVGLVINSRSFDVCSQDKRIIVFIPLPIQNRLFPIIACCFFFRKVFTSLGMCGEIFGARGSCLLWLPFFYFFYFGSSIFFFTSTVGKSILQSQRLVFNLTAVQRNLKDNTTS